MDRVDIKTTENQLKHEFMQGYGCPPRMAEALVTTVIEHSNPITRMSRSFLTEKREEKTKL